MTVNAAGTNYGAALSGSIDMLVGAAFLRLASGVVAQAVNKLAAGPFAQPMLPPTVQLTAKQADVPLANWSATTTGANTASVDLGDGYSLKVDERNSQITIHNAKTNETTNIWGDPHVDVDGKHSFDFWGTTTFQLENGTKITVNTEQYAGNPNMYVASQVVVTKGQNSVVIDGISQNKLGDLSVTVGANGRALDAANRDGFMLYENATGSGWRAETGNIATQADLDATRPGQAYGPGSQTPSLGEFWNVLGSFLFSGRLDITSPASTSREADRPVGHRLHPAIMPRVAYLV